MEFLPYNMPEVHRKIEHGLTIIIIAWDEVPVLHPEISLGITVHISTVC